MSRRRLITLCDLSQLSSQRTTASSRMFSETKRNVTTQVSRCIISALKGCYFSPIAGTSKPLEANIFLATKHRSHNHVLFIGTPKLIVVDFSPRPWRRDTRETACTPTKQRTNKRDEDKAEMGRWGPPFEPEYRRDRSRGRYPRLFFVPWYSASHCFWQRRFIFAARADHFFSRLGSLSVATIVIKSRVNEPHWIGTCAPISRLFRRASGQIHCTYTRYTRRRPEGTASGAVAAVPMFRRSISYDAAIQF